MSHGWIIDIDHMPDETKPAGTNANAKGVVGPRNIPDWMEHLLRNTRQVLSGEPARGAVMYRFRIYDDDGELYYTGRMITDENPPGDEACAGPLDDFGRPNAGASRICYSGHPEMNIG